MKVWHGKVQHRESIVDPWAPCRWQSDEGNQARQDPNLTDDGQQEALIYLLRQPCPPQQAQDEQYVGWNSEEVGLELKVMSKRVSMFQKGDCLGLGETSRGNHAVEPPFCLLGYLQCRSRLLSC